MILGKSFLYSICYSDEISPKTLEKQKIPNSQKTKSSGFFNGPEGNRTPVRKPIPYGVSHHSLYFNIPSIRRLKTNSGLQ